jgi:hypothetical protein
MKRVRGKEDLAEAIAKKVSRLGAKDKDLARKCGVNVDVLLRSYHSCNLNTTSLFKVLDGMGFRLYIEDKDD